MARIRTIKPEFWVDEKVGRLSLRARLLFIAMWNFADDMGTVRGSAPYLRSQAFPYDEVSLGEVSAALSEIIAQGLAGPFLDNGQSYLSIRHFQRHQKINNPSGTKYPNPPEDLWASRSPTVALREPYPQEGKGREGKGSERDQNQNQNPRVVLVGME